MRNTTAVMIPILAVVCAFALFGCKTAEQALDAGEAALALERTKLLYEQGNLTEAAIRCVDLNRSNPAMPGLAELQAKIVRRMTDDRQKAATMRAANTYGQMGAEVDENKIMPGTYGMRQGVTGETNAIKSVLTPMEAAMQKKVKVHLDNVNLNDFVLAIGTSEGVNIIADGMGNTQTMTIHANDTPLCEILDYVSRNLGISFFMGDNIIWATPRDPAQPKFPLETKLYRLRKGLSSDELVNDTGKINIVDAIERFVPKPDGADLLFDRKAHLLIVKNTRDNIAKVEELIRGLDVCPPQVMIEARFLATAISDMRELGVDWILNSALTVSETKILDNGAVVSVPKSQIDSGSSVGFTPFAGSANGLNMSFQGLLTDPMFKVVIHALEASGKARTLSIPKVATINNKAASIRIGEDFRYFEEYTTVNNTRTESIDGVTYTYESATVVPSGPPQLEELGIELNVTPSVGADMTSISLKIVPQISEFLRYEQYEVAADDSSSTTGTTNSTSMVKLPIFKRSKIETEVIVQSGETVAMGGLISAYEVKDVESVPILSSIPFIGRFFKHDSVSESKENLLIFVTATILSERGESLIPIVTQIPQRKDAPATATIKPVSAEVPAPVAEQPAAAAPEPAADTPEPVAVAVQPAADTQPAPVAEQPAAAAPEPPAN